MMCNGTSENLEIDNLWISGFVASRRPGIDDFNLI